MIRNKVVTLSKCHSYVKSHPDLSLFLLYLNSFSNKITDSFENVCYNIRNVKSKHLNCIASQCLSPPCVLFFLMKVKIVPLRPTYDGRQIRAILIQFLTRVHVPNGIQRTPWQIEWACLTLERICFTREGLSTPNFCRNSQNGDNLNSRCLFSFRWDKEIKRR